MSRISILVEPPEGQAIQPVQVSDDMPLRLVLANLVAELDLPEHGSNGPVSYVLEWQGQSLSEHDTFHTLGVRANDRVLVRSQSIGAPSDANLQLPHLKESFAYLPRPGAVAGLTAKGLGTRLVILAAPSSTRTAPIPVANRPTPAPAQPVATGARTAPTPPPLGPRQSPVGGGPTPTTPPPVPRTIVIPAPPTMPGSGKWVLGGVLLVALLAVAFSLGRQNSGVAAPLTAVTVVVAPTPNIINPEPAVTVVTIIASLPTSSATSSSSAVPTARGRNQPTGAPAASQVAVSPPTVISRSDWGAAPASGLSGRQTPNRLVLTHDGQPISGDEDFARKLQSIQRIHQDRGWPDISWHYIVDRNGNVYEGRTPADRGDTSYDFDTTDMITVGVLGDYDSQQPNQAQIESIESLMAWLCQEYNMSPDDIYAHSYFANQSPRTDPKITSPGRNFNIPALQSAVRDRLAGRN